MPHYHDTEVNPEGLIEYVVPKLLPVQVVEEAIKCLVTQPAPEPDDIVVNDDNDQYWDENVSNDVFIYDRVYDHIMVNLNEMTTFK